MKRAGFIFYTILLIMILVLSSCQGAQQKKIRVAMDATWPPFETLDETTNQVSGFDVDLMDAIAKKENLGIEYVNISFDAALAGLAQCQYDAAISAITITDDRKKNMLFSDPYFNAGQIVVVNSKTTDIASKNDLKGKKVGAQVGSTGAIEAQKISGAQYNGYDSIDQAFQDVMNGQLDAVIADNPIGLNYVAKNPTKLKAVGQPFTNEQYGIAVCNKDPDLLKKINDGMAAVKSDGTMDQLVKKWITNPQS